MPNSLQLGNLVQQLKLSGISDSLESRLRQAKDASMPYEELLSMLFQDELDSGIKRLCKRGLVKQSLKK